jgi:hypothetical protein
MNELDWKMPALVGGLITGLLTLIPGVNLLTCCFCGQSLIGGAIASKMLINRTPRPMSSGDGAKVGLMAGLIAAVFYLVLSIPLSLLGASEALMAQLVEMLSGVSSDPNLQESLRQMIEQSANRSAAEKLVSSLIVTIPFCIILGAFCVLGGLIGVALFEKRKVEPPAPPQYPPTYQ